MTSNLAHLAPINSAGSLGHISFGSWHLFGRPSCANCLSNLRSVLVPRVCTFLLLLLVGLLASGCTTAPALHVIGIYEPRAKEVVVNVTDDTKPIVLALTAYDRTVWKLNLKDGVKLQRIILAGYHAQSVIGLPSSTPIEVFSYDPSPCERCWQGPYVIRSSYQEPAVELNKITGLDVTSYQGRYQGVEFNIFPGIKKWREEDRPPTQSNSPRGSAAPT